MIRERRRSVTTKNPKHFREKWKAELEAGDPYYNPNFSLDRSDYALRDPVSGR